MDIPVLKVLGRASVTTLVSEAITRLPASMIPLVKVSGQPEKASDQKTFTESSNSGDSNKPASVITSSLGDDTLATPLPATTPPPDSGTPPQDHKERRGDLSIAQEYSWKLQSQLQLDRRIFHSTTGMFMRGRVALDRLARAFDTALQRHDTFNTSFYEDIEG